MIPENEYQKPFPQFFPAICCGLIGLAIGMLL